MELLSAARARAPLRATWRMMVDYQSMLATRCSPPPYDQTGRARSGTTGAEARLPPPSNLPRTRMPQAAHLHRIRPPPGTPLWLGPAPVRFAGCSREDKACVRCTHPPPYRSPPAYSGGQKGEGGVGDFVRGVGEGDFDRVLQAPFRQETTLQCNRHHESGICGGVPSSSQLTMVFDSILSRYVLARW